MTYLEKAIVTRKYMVEHGLTLKQFADALGYKKSSVNNYLSRPVDTKLQNEFWKKVSLFTGIDFDKEIERKDDEKIVLPKYIAVTLNQQGRTLIGRSLVKRYGQDKIIKHLSKEGIHCKLNKLGTGKDVTYILERMNA